MGVPNPPTASHRTSRRRAHARGKEVCRHAKMPSRLALVSFPELGSANHWPPRVRDKAGHAARVRCRALPVTSQQRTSNSTTFGVPEPGCATNITPRGAVPRTKGNTPPAPKEISGGVIRYLAAPHSSSPEGAVTCCCVPRHNASCSDGWCEAASFLPKAHPPIEDD